MGREFDFGFSLVDENELAVVQSEREIANEAVQDVTTLTGKLDKLYNAIQPLLNNLKANPEKEYIYWPDRSKKIEQFSDILDGIYHGEK